MAKPGEDIYLRIERLIRSRPDIDRANYTDEASYRSDCREAAKYRKPALDLLDKARAHLGPGVAENHLKYYSGRLGLYRNNEIEVKTGQYYPVEYRRHVYEWLKALLRAHNVA